MSSFRRKPVKVSFDRRLFLFIATAISLILVIIPYYAWFLTSSPSKDDGGIDDKQQRVINSHIYIHKPALKSSATTDNTIVPTTSTRVHDHPDQKPPHAGGSGSGSFLIPEMISHDITPWPRRLGADHPITNNMAEDMEAPHGGQSSPPQPNRPTGSFIPDVNNKDVFHDRDIFLDNYSQMNKSLKIYIYPHRKNDPFANVLLPVNYEPSGNYASESYFKKALSRSHFITKNPSQADLFFLPFSIASLRHDKRVGVGGIQNFIRDYIYNISHRFPYWNRTGGADHFYVACHSVGRNAMEKALPVRTNAIQIVCSSSYFLSGYVSHKDASIPQIWPRKGPLPNREPSKREKLAFYAGAMNSRVREILVQVWSNDSEISVHRSRLQTPYSELLLGSKYCIHAKGFEVNTARIGDAIYYGCVPIILADHYDLPFADILNWSSFSVVVSTLDIPLLKKILREYIGSDEYLRLQKSVLKVREHFQWHDIPVDFDAFHMVMYELWLRRTSVRVRSLGSLL